MNPNEPRGTRGDGATDLGRTSADDRLHQNTSELKDELRQGASKATDVAMDKANSWYERGKDEALSELDGVASALHTAASELRRNTSSARSADLVDRLASGIETLSERFEQKEIRDIISDAEGYARNNPAVFFGGAAVLGFLAARFVKATGRRSAFETTDRDFGYNRDIPTSRDLNSSLYGSTRRPEFESTERGVGRGPVEGL
jgi:ElaB/YqjD/DUF883 family membrane-anchored ribosome-binding protein